MADFNDPRLGQRVDGRYTIEQRIADGGMATVYRATDMRLERPVAVKLIHQQLATGPNGEKFLHRFHVEATSAARIADSHIVQVYDTGIWADLPYLVMEYVHGTDLRHRLNTEQTLTVRESLRIITEVLEGLATAHQAGIIHRDIKPENIMLTTRGHVKITDFGLAKALGQNNTGTTGLLLGTASYIAPETIENSTSTATSDIYAVGIMAYEMLTGHVPFAAANAVTTVFRHVNNDIPPLRTVDLAFAGPLSDAIDQLCARDPAHRPHDGAAALALIRGVAEHCDDQLLSYRHVEQPLSSLRGVSGPVSEVGSAAVNADAATDTQTGSGTPAFLHSSQPVVNRVPRSTANAALNTPPAPTQTLTHITEPTQQMNPPLPGGPTANGRIPGHRSGNETGNASSSGQVARTANPRKKRIVTVSIISVLGIAALDTCAWLFGPGATVTVPRSTDTKCTSSVCSLEGSNWSSYKNLLNRTGIPFTASTQYSDTVAKGQIISASRKGGQKLFKRFGPLKVTVSRGEKQVTIPADLLDCTRYPNAATALKKAGLRNVTTRSDWSIEAARGCAVSSSVQPGTTIGHTKRVELTISKGPKPITIPDVHDLLRDDALTRLQDLKLKVTLEQDYSDSVPENHVISISPDVGASAHWGDSITLTISRGPQTVIMPNVIGESKQTAKDRLEKMGFEVKTKSSPIGELLHQVFAQSKQAGTSVRLRDENGKPTVITLTCV